MANTEKIVRLIAKIKIKYQGKWILANTAFDAFESEVECLKKSVGAKEVVQGEVAIGADGSAEAVNAPAEAAASNGSDEAKGKKPKAEEYEKLSKAALSKLLADKGIDCPISATKEEMLAKLK